VILPAAALPVPLLPAASFDASAGAAAWVAMALCVAATGVAGVRWLRVAQREHYLPGSATRFARRWWVVRWANAALGALGVAGVLAAWWVPAAAVLAGAAAAAGPVGLGVRGRTSPLAWTRRLRTLAVTWAVLVTVVVVVGAVTGVPAPVAALAAVGAPVLVDVASLVTQPIERSLAERYVARAAARLSVVAPTVVAITGSYGKTSTKRHVADLVAGTRAVVASPASFNNRAGLARAVNEHLSDDAEVFVAEMGTYGPGEIAALCAWCPPDVSVITAIGPVHLERFGSEERILEAKSEITAAASVVVLAVDDPRLAALADQLVAGGRRVVRAGTRPGADVVVQPRPGSPDGSVDVVLDGRPAWESLSLPAGVQPSNVACAVAVARELDVPLADVGKRLSTLAPANHRLESAVAPGGFVILDDTYNSNPAGARAALGALARVEPMPRTPGEARRVVVTPGMVELGSRQHDENRRFAAAVVEVATDLVVVGRTNRRALLEGAGGGVRVTVVETRAEAVAWVRSALGPGDAVLYENDLPDHYP
jgi:UDP-N-acetylmuramoyl-tripeptide--D-alanyl-D-alanine ligase